MQSDRITLSLSALADCFNYEHQSRASEESADVLAALARRVAGCIADPRESATFLDMASMSGLEVYPPCAFCGEPGATNVLQEEDYPDTPCCADENACHARFEARL